MRPQSRNTTFLRQQRKVDSILTNLIHFIPNFPRWSHPFFNLDTSTVANRDIKNQEQTANSADPDETAHHEPSHLDLHCLNKSLFWSTVLKGFSLVLRALNTCP